MEQSEPRGDRYALLKAGANIEARELKSGRTALMFAVMKNPNAEAIIMVLLNAGADPRVKDSNGLTALDYARCSPKLKGTEALKKLEEASK